MLTFNVKLLILHLILILSTAQSLLAQHVDAKIIGNDSLEVKNITDSIEINNALISKDSIKIVISNKDSNYFIKPWALLRLAIVSNNNSLFPSIQATRLGVKVERKINKKVTALGHVELSMHLGNNDEKLILSPDNSNGTLGLNNASSVPTNKIFNIRELYIGLDFHDYGKLTFGKQSSAYKIIGDRTDISESNSGFASYVFSPDKSDGGITGTGRSNNCLTYQNIYFNRIRLINSLSFRSSRSDSISQTINSISVSAIIKLLKGLDISFGYNQYFLSKKYIDKELIYGLKKNPEYGIVGLSYSRKKLILTACFAIQEFGDLTNVNYTNFIGIVSEKTVVYSGTGFELAGQYRFKKWYLLGGVNIKKPIQDNRKLMADGFKRELIFYGIQYSPAKSFFLYLEGRIENSTDANGTEIPNTALLGIRINI